MIILYGVKRLAVGVGLTINNVKIESYLVKRSLFVANLKYYPIFLLLAGVFISQCSALDKSEEIFGPKPSPAARNFECGKADLWKADANTEDFLKITAQDNIVSFEWLGALSNQRSEYIKKYHILDGKKYLQTVQCTQKLPIWRGARNEIRVVWEIAIESPVFGSAVNPALVLYDKDGKELSTVEMQREWLPTTSGNFRSCGSTWQASADAVSIAPALVFRGNAMRCKIRSVRIEPAQEKIKWNASERVTNYLVPPVQYQPFDVQPKPDVVKMSESQIDEFLAKYPTANPKVSHTSTFRTELSVNGKRINPSIQLAPHCGQQTTRFGEFENAGVKIHAIQIKAGPTSDTPHAPGNVWLGKDKYDFEIVRKAIRDTISRAPDSYVMLNVIVNVYNDWGVEYPDDVHANAEGEKAVCGWSRPVRYGGAAPDANEFWEASNHSKQFSDDGSAFLYALGQWLNSVPEGKIVIGAYINGSVDGQWLFSSDNATGEVQFACYSKGALKAFREYLREKYITNEALSKAWGFDVTFDTAQMPSYYPTRKDGTAFEYAGEKGNSSLLSYNGSKCQGADYNDFLSVSNTKRQIAFCKGLKEGSSGRLLCGSWWPTLPAPYPLSHSAFDLMLESPYVDFISRGGLLGAALHGKLTVDEHDLRNVASGLEAWIDYDEHLIAKSQGEYKRQLTAMVLRSYASGGGYHFYDMWGGWFWNPETMQMVKDAVAMYDYVKDTPSFGEDYVGVFVDEKAANHLADLGRYYQYAAVGNTCESMLTWAFSYAWGQTGLPVRFYLLKDVENSDLVVPKTAIFLSPLTMTAKQAQAVKDRFYNNGRVVAYLGMPGLAADGDTNNPADITGFNIFEDQRTQNKVLVPFADDPLLKGIQKDSMLCFWLLEMSYYPNASVNPKENDKVLATYSESDIPGMVVRREKSHTTVWIGFPGAITPQLVRNLAQESGVTPWITNDSELIVGAGLLGVIGITSGPQEVMLPPNYEIEKCLSGHNYKVKNGKLTFNLGYGDIYGDVAVFAVNEKSKK